MANKSAAFPAFAQLQDSVHNLQPRRGTLIESARKRLARGKDTRRKMDHLLSQATAFRETCRARREDRKALEARAAGALSEIRTQAAKRLEPLVGRLDPSKHEVELLAKRLSSLEKKVDDLLSARHERADRAPKQLFPALLGRPRPSQAAFVSAFESAFEESGRSKIPWRRTHPSPAPSPICLLPWASCRCRPYPRSRSCTTRTPSAGKTCWRSAS